jgi:hypothetical protein|tara:strand:- start:303 stop:407 length:105 start_codon:yes stop_codon:yes gene_type:complete
VDGGLTAGYTMAGTMAKFGGPHTALNAALAKQAE